MRTTKSYNLMFCSLGNGISVCDTNTEENGDYKKVAHISKYRIVEYTCKLPTEVKTQIEDYAKNADPKISISQDEKVFIV